MITTNIHQAKTHLSALLTKIENDGETVLICRNGTPVAQLACVRDHRQTDPLKPRPELARVKIQCELTAPLTEEEWPKEYR